MNGNISRLLKLNSQGRSSGYGPQHDRRQRYCQEYSEGTSEKPSAAGGVTEARNSKEIGRAHV